MMVTFLPAIPMLLGMRNGVQVIPESQPMTSPISVSGFMFSLRMALPDGYFLQELNSFSPGYSTRPDEGLVVPATGAAGAGAAPGVAGSPGACCGSFHLRAMVTLRPGLVISSPLIDAMTSPFCIPMSAKGPSGRTL